jgi:hypothetical protein
MNDDTLLTQASRHLASMSWGGLSAPAQRKLLLCVHANLSVAVGGSGAMRLPRPAPGRGHLLLDGGETPSDREAAFYNAGLMHARTQDDFHPIGNLHIATCVLPALLAAAEGQAQALTGTHFLDALVVGYAAATGFSRRFSPSTTPRGLRSTSLYATLGAAAAVARLRGLGEEGIANTIALASQSAFGTTQCWRDGSDEYQLHAGNAASQALLCARLTQAGVVGGLGALDGQSAFYPALTGRRPSFTEICTDFDPDAAILETVLKRYPVSGICQPVVRLAERLAARLKGRSVDRLRLWMNPFEMNYPGTLNAGPVFRSFSDKLMSARLCVASVLVTGRFDFKSFTKPTTVEVAGLVARSEVLPGHDLGTLSCRLELTLQDGCTIEGELLDGGSELAIDWDSIGAWAEELWCGGGRPVGDAEKAARAVLALPHGTFDELRQHLKT